MDPPWNHSCAIKYFCFVFIFVSCVLITTNLVQAWSQEISIMVHNSWNHLVKVLDGILVIIEATQNLTLLLTLFVCRISLHNLYSQEFIIAGECSVCLPWSTILCLGSLLGGIQNSEALFEWEKFHKISKFLELEILEARVIFDKSEEFLSGIVGRENPLNSCKQIRS